MHCPGSLYRHDVQRDRGHYEYGWICHLLRSTATRYHTINSACSRIIHSPLVYGAR